MRHDSRLYLLVIMNSKLLMKLKCNHCVCLFVCVFLAVCLFVCFYLQAISIYTVHPVKDFNDTSYTNVHIPDAVFQQLNADTKQQGPVYQHLNPSTMQEESVYELLTTKAMLTHAE